MKRLLVILAIVILSGALAPSARADSIVFDLAPGASTSVANYINYTGVPTDPCFGVTLQVASVTGQGTPSNSGTTISFIPPTPIFSPLLSFTTGAFTGSDATHWFFAGGGTISIVPNPTSDTPLLTGTFQDPTLTLVSDGTINFHGTFTATLAPTLLSFYGYGPQPPPIFQGTIDISATIANSLVPPDPIFTAYIESGNLTLTPVPVPGSLLLLGSGLLGLAARRRQARG